MVAYKLSKNGWVMPFFVIFRLAREKLLVTVALDHPVLEFESLEFKIASVFKSQYLAGYCSIDTLRASDGANK